MTLALRMLLRIKTKKWDAGASQDPLVAKLMRDEWNGDQLYLPHTRRCSLFQWRYGGMEDGEPEPKCTCGTTSLAQSRLLEFFLLRLKCKSHSDSSTGPRTTTSEISSKGTSRERTKANPLGVSSKIFSTIRAPLVDEPGRGASSGNTTAGIPPIFNRTS